MEFRQDINGLRALAVVAVMFYHFGLPGFSGGFGGVDVFFVISGFLMTGIILTGMAADKFSLLTFYASRCRRLLPALIALCAVLLLAGWFWLPPTDYKQLGRHTATAIVFASNFIFKNEDGYFDTFSQDKWLLHTWSLSVEWQFYLLYPVLLAGLTRLLRGRLSWQLVEYGLLAVTALSLAACVIVTSTNPAFAFYMLPTRLWEMSAGGLVFLWSRRLGATARPGLFWTGLAAIAASIVFFDSNTVWPGAAATLPVVGTALVILANRGQLRAFAHPVVRALGAWSYSIYLWHWPVVVALRQFDLSMSPLWDAAGVGLSVALGALSYHLIETPLRKRSKQKIAIALVAAVFLVTGLAAYAVDAREGFASRATPAVRGIEKEVADSRASRPRPCTSDPFIFGTTPCETAPAAPDYIIWGDSHASALFNAIVKAGGARPVHAFQATCPPVPNAILRSKKYSYICPEFTDTVFDRVQALPPDVPVIAVFRLPIYIHGYNERPDKQVGLQFTDLTAAEEKEDPADVFITRLTSTLCRMASGGRPVYVLQAVPEIGIDVPREMTREIMFKGAADDISLPLSAHRQRQTEIDDALLAAQKKCGIHLLDPAPYLCDAGSCHGSENGRPLYTDDNHLGNEGADRLVPLFSQVFLR